MKNLPLLLKIQMRGIPAMSNLLMPDDAIITITERARNYFEKFLKKSGVISDDCGIRIAVKAGGCHGLQYIVEPVPQRKKDDLVIMLLGVKIYIDQISRAHMLGTEIDCSDNLIEPLIFKNPLAKSACGCGASFELK